MANSEFDLGFFAEAPLEIGFEFSADEIVAILQWLLLYWDQPMIKSFVGKSQIEIEINIHGKPTKSLWGFLVDLPYQKEIKNNLWDQVSFYQWGNKTPFLIFFSLIIESFWGFIS